MREQKYHVYLTADEQSRVIQSLIRLKMREYPKVCVNLQTDVR